MVTSQQHQESGQSHWKLYEGQRSGQRTNETLTIYLGLLKYENRLTNIQREETASLRTRTRLDLWGVINLHSIYHGYTVAGSYVFTSSISLSLCN